MSIRKRVLNLLTCLLMAGMMANVLAATAKHTKAAGKTGEITIVQQVKVGNLVLLPGDYKVQHRRSGDKDVIRFRFFRRVPLNGWYWGLNQAGDVPCTIEPTDRAATETSFSTVKDHDELRISQIVIAGEGVAYRF